MGRSDAMRLGALPNATGALTRLAYTHANTKGADPRPWLRHVNITPHQIRDTNARLHVRDQIEFLNLAAEALQDDLLGFHLALETDLRELGFLYYVSASSEILSDALQRLTRYASIANEAVAPTFFHGKDIRVRMAILVRLCRHLTGSRLVPKRVRLMHRRDGKYPEMADFFGTNVEFGASVDEVTFNIASNEVPIISADQYLNKLLIAYCEDALRRRPQRRGAFRSSVENAIVPLLPHGKAKVDEIARRLGVSQRTLARRLSHEQMSFSAVLENLKIDLADRYLADEDLSISQVAWLLGYQEVSSFTHAFKRWTSKTPRQVRSQKAA